MARRRLDAELVRRQLATSRERAQALVEAGVVKVNGAVATKSATQVDEAAAIVVVDAEADHYVSRAAHKLIGALEAFPEIEVRGRSALDAGASTGGFTQVLLERGIARVLAVDVGYGQLAWSVRTDPRVTPLERTNLRLLQPNEVPYRADLVVADLSFISLRLVLPALLACTATECDYVLMVKPQFEVGREQVGQGVVRDPELRSRAVLDVAAAAVDAGLVVHGVAASPLPGPSGNVEYFLWLHRGDNEARRPGTTDLDAIAAQIAVAVREGPQ